MKSLKKFVNLVCDFILGPILLGLAGIHLIQLAHFAGAIIGTLLVFGGVISILIGYEMFSESISSSKGKNDAISDKI